MSLLHFSLSLFFSSCQPFPSAPLLIHCSSHELLYLCLGRGEKDKLLHSHAFLDFHFNFSFHFFNFLFPFSSPHFLPSPPPLVYLICSPVIVLIGLCCFPMPGKEAKDAVSRRRWLLVGAKGGHPACCSAVRSGVEIGSVFRPTWSNHGV